MKSYKIIFASLGALLGILILGCSSTTKPHSWQLSSDDLRPILQDATNWTQLSTNDYVRVSESRKPESIALLHDQSFLPLNESQLSAFAPGYSARSGAQPYLVRGLSHSIPPIFTIVRYDRSTGRLLIQQATYNGEMLWPYPSVAEPNALVVFLPSAPSQVYPHPMLGGDGIFRGTKRLDSR